MSVDDAFRKLMQTDLLGRAASPAAAKSLAATAIIEPTPLPPPPASTTVVRKPAPAEPAPAVVDSGPKQAPVDFARVARAKRLAYHPVDSHSQIAEEYRILRTRLMAMELKKNSILLTSCHHNEGKTSTALNLALCLAKRRNSRILLVDFDLRRPRLHKMTGIPSREVDIVSVLRGTCELEDAMLYSEEDNLYILNARREYANGTDFLETKRARDLIERMHENFDFVVLDSCPCLSTSDPAVLGPYVGGVVMVVRCLQTQRESIEHAINSLRDLGVPVVGVILTFMRYFIPRYLYRYQYYHGYYYYRGYGNGEVDAAALDEAEDGKPPEPAAAAEGAG